MLEKHAGQAFVFGTILLVNRIRQIWIEQLFAFGRHKGPVETLEKHKGHKT